MAFNPRSLLNAYNHASLHIELASFPMAYGTYESIGPFELHGWELEVPNPHDPANRLVSKGYNIALKVDVAAGTNPPVAWFLGQNLILFKLPQATDGQWYPYYLLTFTNRTELRNSFTPAVPINENNGNIACMCMTVNDNRTHYLWTIDVDNAARTYMHV